MRYRLVGVALLAAVACGGVAVTTWRGAPELPQPARVADAKSALEDERLYQIPPRPQLEAAGPASLERRSVAPLRDETFEVAESVVAAFPRAADAVCLLATVHHRHNNNPAAIELLSACLRLDPQFADAHRMLGHMAMEQGDHAQAEHHFRDALAVDPDWRIIPPALAETLFLQSKFQEAVEILAPHCRRYPQDVQTLCKLGVAYLQTREPERAKECFAAALDVDPQNAEACNGLANVMRALGDHSQAETYTKRCCQLTATRDHATRRHRPDFNDTWRMQRTLINTCMTAARVCLKQGDVPRAAAHCRRAAELDCRHIPSREMLCDLLVQQGDTRGLQDACRELVDAAPEGRWRLVQAGHGAVSIGTAGRGRTGLSPSYSRWHRIARTAT